MILINYFIKVNQKQKLKIIKLSNGSKRDLLKILLIQLNFLKLMILQIGFLMVCLLVKILIKIELMNFFNQRKLMISQHNLRRIIKLEK